MCFTGRALARLVRSVLVGTVAVMIEATDLAGRLVGFPARALASLVRGVLVRATPGQLSRGRRDRGARLLRGDH